MTDGVPPAPQPPSVIPPVVPPVPPVQLPAPPVHPIIPPTQPIQPAPMPQLIGPILAQIHRLTDRDAEVHLLRTNEWMDTHAFPEGVDIQQIC